MGKYRWPAEIVTYRHEYTWPDGRVETVELNCKINFDPKTGAPHGTQLWLTDRSGKGHAVDQCLADAGAVISRVMQGREP